MKVKRIILMLLLGFLASSLPAREVLKLNLEGAKKQAIQYNKTLKNAGYAIDKSEFQIKEAISSGLPQVSSTLDYSNALGAKLSIRFTNSSEEYLTCIIEDNGIGVPDDQKEYIFEKGVGKNTGLGLFLCREILAITDLSIRENGTYGKGARFLITAPSERWRIGAQTVNGEAI